MVVLVPLQGDAAPSHLAEGGACGGREGKRADGRRGAVQKAAHACMRALPTEGALLLEPWLQAAHGGALPPPFNPRICMQASRESPEQAPAPPRFPWPAQLPSYITPAPRPRPPPPPQRPPERLLYPLAE